MTDLAKPQPENPGDQKKGSREKPTIGGAVQGAQGARGQEAQA